MPKYSAKFFEKIDPIIIDDYVFDAFSRIAWTRYGPLNVIPGNTRFCWDDAPFAVMYCAQTLETAFCETFVRGQFDKKIDRVMSLSAFKDRERAILQTQDPLRMVDLRRNNSQKFSIPMGVTRNTDHRAGRNFAKNLHAFRRDVDGIVFPSRLIDGGECVAVFERALYKIDVIAVQPLDRLPAMIKLLEEYRFTFDPKSRQDDG